VIGVAVCYYRSKKADDDTKEGGEKDSKTLFKA
jgi:hypothetical protein